MTDDTLQFARGLVSGAITPDGGHYLAGAVQDAAELVRAHFTHADGPTLRRWRGGWYHWIASSGCYREMSDEQLDKVIYRALGKGKRSEVAEVRAALIAINGVLIDGADLGSWIGGAPDGMTEPRDIAACANGLVHLPSGLMVPATPRYFTTSTLGTEHRVLVGAPAKWLEFLRAVWPDDEESIAALQEWFGYMLTADTEQQKILLLVGPKRAGKGVITRVLTSLLGRDSVASPTLASLADNFGLAPLIGATAAIIEDARLGGRSDTAKIMERLLTISGQGRIDIDRKYRDPWRGYLSARFTIVSNELPRFSDASGALASRMLVLQLTRSWYGNEDTGLTRALLEELPEILAWSIEGWRRLRARGAFVQPAASADVADELADLGSPVAAWVRESCTVAGGARVLCAVAYQDFLAWCRAEGIERPITQTVFGRDLKAMGHERIQSSEAGRPRYYTSLAVGAAPAAPTCTG